MIFRYFVKKFGATPPLKGEVGWGLALCFLLFFIICNFSFAQDESEILTCPYTFTNELKVGSTGPDVKLLQTILNTDKRTQVATDGPGSPTNESEDFGKATEDALKRFQNLFYGDLIKKITGVVDTDTKNVLNEICSGETGSSQASVNEASVKDQNQYIEDENIYLPKAKNGVLKSLIGLDEGVKVAGNENILKTVNSKKKEKKTDFEGPRVRISANLKKVEAGKNFKVMVNLSEEIVDLTPDAFVVDGGNVAEIRKLSKTSYMTMVNVDEDTETIKVSVEAEKLSDLQDNLNDRSSNEIVLMVVGGKLKNNDVNNFLEGGDEEDGEGGGGTLSSLLDKILNGGPTCNYNSNGLLVRTNIDGSTVNVEGCAGQKSLNLGNENLLGQNAGANQNSGQNTEQKKEEKKPFDFSSIGSLLGNLFKGGLFGGGGGGKSGGEKGGGEAGGGSPAGGGGPAVGGGDTTGGVTKKGAGTTEPEKPAGTDLIAGAPAGTKALDIKGTAADGATTAENPVLKKARLESELASMDDPDEYMPILSGPEGSITKYGKVHKDADGKPVTTKVLTEDDFKKLLANRKEKERQINELGGSGRILPDKNQLPEVMDATGKLCKDETPYFCYKVEGNKNHVLNSPNQRVLYEKPGADGFGKIIQVGGDKIEVDGKAFKKDVGKCLLNTPEQKESDYMSDIIFTGCTDGPPENCKVVGDQQKFQQARHFYFKGDKLATASNCANKK